MNGPAGWIAHRARRPSASLLLSLAAAFLGSPRTAPAAFELRDASPSALGAASLDLPADALVWDAPPGDPWSPSRGPWVAASHADLYDVAGLGFDRAAAGHRGERVHLAVSYARVGGAGAGATESTIRLEARERGDRAIAVGGAIERLAFAVDGEPEAGGWAASVAAHARLSRDPVRGEFTVAADRIARGSAVDRLGAAASLVLTARAASGPAALTYVDRLGSERGSPRLVADLALGEGASLRVSRGRAPGRFGVGVVVRWRAIAVSAGRLDDAGGGVVSAAEVRFGTTRRPRPPRRRRFARDRRRRDGTGVPLLARDPSAIMRRHGTIRQRTAGFVAGVGAALLALAGAGTSVAAESSGVWLPLPPEEIESPDRLAEPPFQGDAAIGGDVIGGRWTAMRFAARARTGPFAVTAGRIESWAAGVARQTILVSALRERIRIGAGRVVARDAPVLLGEAARFSRRLRRPLEPRAAAPGWETPRSAASLGVDGASLAVESAPAPRGRAAWAVWGLGGRSTEDGEALAAAGFAHRTARWDAAASVARRFGSVAGVWRGRTGVVSLEALVSRERGPALLAAVTVEASGSPVGFGARWRRRSGERRPVAAEFSAEAGARRAGTARLTWRPWSASGSAFADDGAVELDARWRVPGAPGAARLRLGRRGGEGTAAARAYSGAGGTVGSGGAAAIPERYAVLDLPLAGERGRLVSLLASRRERGGAGARAIGTTVGARARLGWRGRASVTAQVDAARTRGSTASGGAWTSAIAASGDETLTARAAGGVYVTVSGWLRAGPVALRVHARDGEDGRGGRPLTATIWLEWSGSAMRSRPPGDAGSGG